MFKKAAAFLLLTSTSFAFSTYAQTTVPGSIAGEFDVKQGAANYSIPISVVPGRAGLQPDLSLNYSSNGGNRIMGSWLNTLKVVWV